MFKNILFTATWCNPCKQLKQWLEANNIEVELVDIDENPSLAKNHGVRGVPALLTTEGLKFGNENIRPYLGVSNGNS